MTAPNARLPARNGGVAEGIFVATPAKDRNAGKKILRNATKSMQVRNQNEKKRISEALRLAGK
jgi:hypothetical protein